jgi:hypothetical protein
LHDVWASCPESAQKNDIAQNRKFLKIRGNDRTTKARVLGHSVRLYDMRNKHLGVYMESGFDSRKQGRCQVSKKKNEYEDVPEKRPRVSVLHTMNEETKRWLDAEKRKTGRTISFMIEEAVRQWKDRIEKRRKSDD